MRQKSGHTKAPPRHYYQINNIEGKKLTCVCLSNTLKVKEVMKSFVTELSKEEKKVTRCLLQSP